MSQYAATNPVRELDNASVALAVLPLVGRILISAIFLLSGISKIIAPAAMIGYIASAGLPLPQAGLAIAIVVEVAGSIALILGFHARWTAAIRERAWRGPSMPVGSRNARNQRGETTEQ
jgi:putative oxidoreductase